MGASHPLLLPRGVLRRTCGLAKRVAPDQTDDAGVASQVIAATNRADILDRALMRSGRLDRKIEFPHPTEDARAKILQASTSVLSRIIWSVQAPYVTGHRQCLLHFQTSPPLG